ncbi:zinc metalloprotease HtpX, partial [bacterium]|nr:zinc metalloprotease HtpX [bacterium]
MYNEIAANKRNTVFLIAIFTVVIVALGFVLGEQTGSGSAGILVATVVATVMNLVGYFAGDSVALAASGAKKIEKRQAPELWNMVENLTIASGMPMPAVYVIDDPAANAFATGRDPQHASIAVTTGLVARLNAPELEGVIAHELSHIRNYDIRVMTIVVVLVGIVMLLSDWLLRGALFRRNDRNSGQAGVLLLLVGIVLAILSPILAELIKLAVSRRREYLADASGALLTRHPDPLEYPRRNGFDVGAR